MHNTAMSDTAYHELGPPPVDATPPAYPLWNAGVHVALVVLAYIMLTIWVSFGPNECPKK